MVERDMIIWLKSASGEGAYYPKDELWASLIEIPQEQLSKELDKIHKTKGWKKNKELRKRESFVFSVWNGKNFERIDILQKKYGMDLWFKAMKEAGKKFYDLDIMENILIKFAKRGK